MPSLVLEAGSVQRGAPWVSNGIPSITAQYAWSKIANYIYRNQYIRINESLRIAQKLRAACAEVK